MAGQYPWTPLVGKLLDNRGPWSCSLIASLLFPLALGSFSHRVQAMLDTSHEPPQSVYLLIFLFGVAGFATVFSYLSSLFSATKTFPEYPGIAAGTVTTLFGLSPLFLSSLASGFFTNPVDNSLDIVGFLGALAILTGIVHLIGAFNFRTESLIPATVSHTRDDEVDETAPLIQSTSTDTFQDSSLLLIRDLRFWILFLLLAVLLGPCEMIIANVGSVVLSLPSGSNSSGSSASASLQVKILAISNTVTRLFVGPLADLVSPVSSSTRRHYISRVVFLLVPAIVLTLTFLWMGIVVHSQADLWALSVGTGIAYGATFTILPSIMSAVWGTRHAARNFGFIVYAPLTGTVIFSYLYALVSKRHTPVGGFCQGFSCWQATFWICMGLQVVAICWSLMLWRGWKGLL
ncbi:putative transporter MCH1 [Favolaschia claudopus]|uniref:Transporter MCH1 n=1 Tax=Favolaschia claudopus TaxID=2862362 RepID=A0AAW0ANS2_9AGAR